MEKENHEDRKASVEEALFGAAVQWRVCLKAMGALLLELEGMGYSAEFYQIRLREEFRIPMVQTDIGMRWARGDFGSDENAALLMRQFDLGILAQMSNDTIANVLTGKHIVFSVEESRVVPLTLTEMSPKTARRNISAQGFKPIGENVDREPAFRFCRAERIEHDYRGRVMLITTLRGETVRVAVSQKLLNELIALAAKGSKEDVA